MSNLFLYGVGLPLTLWLVIIGGMLWLAAQTKRKRFVWIISCLGALVLGALVVDALFGCVHDPSGQAAPVCGGPLSPLLRVTVYVTAPLALVGQALLTWWMLDKTD
jgi:hypothetical protein